MSSEPQNVPPSTDSPDDEPRAGTQAGSLAGVIGEMVWLLAASAQHRNNLLIADLEWYLLPAANAGQVRLFRDQGRPVGFALWARVSPEVEQRLAGGGYKLRESDWRSGERTWLVDLVAPFGGAEQMLEDLCRSALAEHRFSFVRRSADGRAEIATLTGSRYPGEG